MFSFNRNNYTSDYPDTIIRIEECLGLVSECGTSKEDLIFLYSVIFSKKPLNVLEIGRSTGASTLIMAGALADNGVGRLFSVDIKDNVNNNTKNVLEYNTVLIIDSSTNLDKNSILANIKFQVFFIDGDHSTDMVINDINQCLALADSECVLLCHDVNMPEVRKGIDIALKNTSHLFDCGTYGSSIQLLVYKNIS